MWSSLSKMKSEVLEVPALVLTNRAQYIGFDPRRGSLTSERLLGNLLLTLSLVDEEELKPSSQC